MSFKRIFTLICMLMGVLTSSGIAQNYAAPVNYPTDLRPQALVHGDFNGDGKEDIIVANEGASTLTFFAGNGDGTFANGVAIPLDGVNPIGLATADFNGDGNKDLAVTYNTSSIQLELLLGNGNGTFQPSIVLPIPAPASCCQGNGAVIHVADFDGNGTPDIAISSNSGGLFFYFNNGSASFTSPTTTAINSANVGDFAVCDFNRDGHPDVVLIASAPFATTATVELSLGNGNGTFQPSTILASTQSSLGGIACADFNGDGLPDVVYTSSSVLGGQGTITILLQQSDGSFVAAPPINSVIEPTKVITGDWNGDGNQDFAVIHGFFSSSGQPDEIVTFLGNRDGTFTLGQRFTLPSNPINLMTGSFTGTNAPDLAVADFSGNALSVLINQGADKLSLQSSRQPVEADLPVGFTATVTGVFQPGTPTGSVIFADGNTTLGTANLDASGVATLTVQLTTAGTHNILAVYGGDAAFVGGTSAKFAQRVVRGGSLPLLTGPTIGNFGATQVFSGAVVPFNAGGSPTPSGTVTLVVDGANFATATLDAGGQASFSSSSFAIGTHSAMLNYPGDGIYSGGGSSPLNFSVRPAVTSMALSSSVNPSVSGQSSTLTATVSAPQSGGTPAGTVTFTDGGTSLGTLTLNASGQASLSFASAAVGQHAISVSYAGNSNFQPSNSSLVQTVNKSPSATSLSNSPNPSVSGQSITFVAQVTANVAGVGIPTGTVTFSDNGSSIGTAVLDATGKATFSVSSLLVASHSITASYGGDANFNPSSAAGGNAVSQTVNKSPTATTLTSAPNPSVSGQAVILSASVTAAGGGSGIPTGTVAFSDNGSVIGNATLDGTGKAVLSITSLRVGSHSTTATYLGDANFNPSQASGASGVSQTVNKSPSSSSLTSSVSPSVFGQAITFTATVVPSAGGGGVPSGPVTFSDAGSVTLGTATLDNSGNATLTLSSLSTGSHSISAAYAGDGNFQPSTAPGVTQTVNKSGSSTSLTNSPNPSSFGQTVTFAVTVNSVSGVGTPTGTINFVDGSTTLGSAVLDSTGKTTFTTGALSVGSHMLTASFSGDSNFQSSTSAPTTQVVNKSASAVTVATSQASSSFGQSLILTAAISAAGNGTGVPSGSVTFMDGTTALGTTAIDNAGTATLVISTLAVGTHSIGATYAGDSNFFNSTSAPLQQTVNKSGTSTTLTVDSNPSLYGQAVVLSITVAPSGGSGTPSGTVIINDGGTSLGTVTLDQNGKATFTISSLGVGSHDVTANYRGDGSFTPSSASGPSAVAQTVNQSPTVGVVSSSSNPSVFGQVVTLTAVVSASGAGGGVPSGTITFMDGAMSLGSTSLDNTGTAALTTSSLAVGAHSISIHYAGNANYLSSNSGTLSQSVNKNPVSVALTSALNPSAFGQSIAFTVHVSPISPGSPIPSGSVSFLDGVSSVGSGTLDASGHAVLNLTALPAGAHSITANYLGDGGFLASSSAPLRQDVNKSGTTITVSSSSPTSVPGQPVTLTIAVTASGRNEVPSGSVLFLDGGVTIGSGTLNASGQASLTLSSLAVGQHAITANYAGSDNFLASSSALVSQTVSNNATTTTVSVSGNPSTFGQSVTFTVAVSGTDIGVGKPTGSVDLLDGTTVLATSVLDQNGTTTFLIGSTNLSVGLHSITGSYRGSSGFLPSSSSTLLQIVNKASTSTLLTTTPNPATNGSSILMLAAVSNSVAEATGSVVFMDGQTRLGSGAVDGKGNAVLTIATLGTGSHNLAAVYSGDTNFSGSGSPLVQQIVLDPHSLVVVTSSQNPQSTTQSVTFAARVTSPLGEPLASGTITFLDGGAIVATTPVSSSLAQFTATGMSVGDHQIVAIYQQSSSPGPSDGRSSVLVQTITRVPPNINVGGTNQDYTVTLESSEATVVAGEKLTNILALTPVNGLSGEVAATCTGLPVGATCAVNPNPALLDGRNPVSAMVTVVTTGADSNSKGRKTPGDAEPVPDPKNGKSPLRFGLITGGLFLPLLARKRLRGIGLVSLLALWLIGCAHTRFVTTALPSATPAGTYTITVSTTSGTLTHSTQFLLSVTDSAKGTAD